MEHFDEVDVRVLAAAGPVGLMVQVLRTALAAAAESFRRWPAA
jgi:hypothetical protein